ncbi:MAG TPA: RHS repeat-associated core domain-containing protein, partial [bacterium]|nr:RHS repeat-associated core domain-containing protein [bacterium]
VIGKVKSVQTPNNMLNFAYNPFGQRQIKRTTSDSSYYVLDATGNVMSIYVKDYPKIIAKERPIYGSSRLGIMNKEVEFNLTGNFLSKSNSTIGIKEYELCDHLSNVSVVVLDRKDCFNSVFKPIVKTYTDYYPFGYPISSRTDNVDYRYGFNGQEGDNEIYGDKLDYAFTYRMYDSRIGRFWSVDPLIDKFSFVSPYTYAFNNPIFNNEFEGLEGVTYTHKLYFKTAGITIFKKNIDAGFSPLGAAFAIGQSAYEANYGIENQLKKCIRKNNYWGMKANGKTIEYSSLNDGYNKWTEMMKDRFSEAYQLLQGDFTYSQLQKAINEGTYKYDPGNKDYVKNLLNNSINILKRMITVVDEEIKDLEMSLYVNENKLLKENNFIKKNEIINGINSIKSKITEYNNLKIKINESIEAAKEAKSENN